MGDCYVSYTQLYLSSVEETDFPSTSKVGILGNSTSLECPSVV